MAQDEMNYSIISSAFTVFNTLGTGFLEKVYQKSLGYELASRGFDVDLEKTLPVYYKDKHVGVYYADIVVNDSILIETKCVNKIIVNHIKQVKNYLRSTGYAYGYLFNFAGLSVEYNKIFNPVS